MVDGRQEILEQRRAVPCALTIAGIDPSGGAGIAADLRAFARSGVWGCAVCSVVTIQSTAGLVSTVPMTPHVVLQQAREVLRHQRIRAIKTGALGSAAVIQAVCSLLRQHRDIPVVIDPVMAPTRAWRQARLLDEAAVDAMRAALALATVVTPNAQEAEALLGIQIRNTRELAKAAEQLMALGPKAVVIKGGHLVGPRAVDVLATAGGVTRLSASRLNVPAFHGAGCTFASLIAGHLARCGGSFAERDMVDAVRLAKRRLRESLRNAQNIGDGLLVLPLTPHAKGPGCRVEPSGCDDRAERKTEPVDSGSRDA